MGCIKKPWFNTFALLVCMLGLMGFLGTEASGADEIGGWKWKADASMGFSYDTNVFKLSSLQSDRFDQNRPSDQKSGRFNGMDSIDDFVFTPRLRATLSRHGLQGRKLSVTPSIAYNRYVQDQEKSYFDFGLGINQKVGKHGNVGLDFGYAPNIYKKNYLSGAVDKTGNGISGGEKVFSPAHHDDTTVVLSYGQRLWKSHHKHRKTLAPDSVSAKVRVGYENRNFDDPFTVRTEDNFLAGLDLGLALHKNTDLTLSYLFKSISTTVGPEVLIRDEPFFGVDLNGNGNTTDLSVATQQNVDRSRDQHSVGVKVTTRLQKGWYGHVKYEARFTSFNSKEPFDVTRLNRSDTRQKVGLGVKGQLAPRWTMALNWSLTHNEAARDGLALVDKAEGKSYDRNIFSAVVSYLF